MTSDNRIDTGGKRRRRFAKQLWWSRVALYSVAVPMFTLAALPLDGAKRIVLLILGFSLIIFVHELGHFIAARWCSVKTETFSIGIGPRMVGWRKGIGLSFGNEPAIPEEGASPAEARTAGEKEDERYARKPFEETPPAGGSPGATHETTVQTGAGPVKIEPDTPDLTGDILGRPRAKPREIGQCDYRLSWLPLGGYVRMLGQDDMDPTKVSEDAHAFNNRPIWQRMIIVSAGVTMNILFAIAVFTIVFRPGGGVQMPPAMVGGVLCNAPAYGHLRMGDVITSVDGDKPREGFLEFADVVIASALADRGDKVHFDFVRDGQAMQTDIEPQTSTVTGLLAVGIEPMPSLKVHKMPDADVDALDLPQPELKKLRAGDVVKAADGQPVADYPELVAALQKIGHAEVTLTLANSNPQVTPHEIQIHLQSRLEPGPGLGEPVSVIAGLALRPAVAVAVPGKPAAKAGLRPGDVIVRVGATADPTLAELRATLERNASQSVQLDVLRDGKVLTIPVTPEAVSDGGREKGQIGIGLAVDYDHPIIAAPAVDSGPLAHLERGSTLLAVNDQPVANWYDARRILLASEGKDATFRIKSPSGTETTVTVGVDAEQHTQLADRMVYQCGLPLELLTEVQKSNTYAGAIAMGLSHTYKFVMQTYLTIGGLFTRTVPTSALHGPLGIAKITYDVQEKGLSQLLLLMAIISVNLAVANFLPLPIVDGGLFLLLLVEKLRGKPLPLKVLNAINIAGIGLLASVFLYVTLHNDLGLFMQK